MLLGERILKHTDKLSKTLQDPTLTASEGQQCAELTCATLSSIRSSESFDLFWERVLSFQRKYDVEEASLPRKRRAPSRLEIGSSQGYQHSTAKDHYCQEYYECLDFIISAIRERFNQPGYGVLKQLERLLLKAARREEYRSEHDFVLKHYHNDFVASSLETRLELLPTMFSLPEKPTLSTIRAHITGLSPATRIGISEVCILLKLILVIPATNAISERSACRVKTYLRTSMSQMRVNNLCVLHAHKDRTDGISIVSCLNDFVSSREHRFEVFGKF